MKRTAVMARHLGWSMLNGVGVTRGGTAMTATAANIQELAREIESVVGPQGLISRPEQLRVYESDGLTVFRQAPALVVLPTTTAEVRDVVRLCQRYGVPFVPRGSGTGLSGGALPVEGCVVIGLSK